MPVFLLQEQQGLEGNFDADGAWDQRPRHCLLNRELGPPAGTVARYEDRRVEAFQVRHRAVQLGFVARGKVEAAHDGVEGGVGAYKLEGMFGGVDYAGVATACEYDQSFACGGQQCVHWQSTIGAYP